MSRRRPLTRNRLLVILLLAGLAIYQYYQAERVQVDDGLDASGDVVQAAFDARRSGIWLETPGRIKRLLADDNEGSRHQKFILELEGGHTVLVAHNTDLAERIPARQGQSVMLRGRYEWNKRGGLIHWTHHDPDGRQSGGWIEVDGVRYE